MDNIIRALIDNPLPGELEEDSEEVSRYYQHHVSEEEKERVKREFERFLKGEENGSQESR